MKITIDNTYKKQYIELLPTITFSYERKNKIICLMWLYWALVIKL